MNATAHTFTIYTSGRVSSREGTLDDVKTFVQDHAPMKRGWTGAWSQCETALDRWTYRRKNGRGRVLPNLSITIVPTE